MAGQLRGRYDIVINGGGIVGFTLLNLILKTPHLNRCKVLLIEQAARPRDFSQPPRERDETKIFSNRVSSISYASKAAFKKLGVWDTVRPYAKDIQKIKVWNYDYNHKLVFNQDLSSCQKDKQERDIVFSVLENNRLSNALLDSIHKIPQSSDSILWSSKLVNISESLDAGTIDVSIQDEQGQDIDITGSLVLGCDGYKSKVRELTGMKYRECDLKKSAVVGTVKMSAQLMNSENNVAYQKFSAEKDTVAALLPLDGEYSSFVISAPVNYAKHLAECDDDTFVQEFNLLLTSSENPTNPILRGAHEAANLTYDNLKSILQLVGPRLGISPSLYELDFDLGESPSLDRVIENSRATFPLIFGTTSPRMVTSLPGLNRIQIGLLGDASHRVHPLAGQGLNLGIQDAIELVRQLECLAKSGEKIFSEPSLLCKALSRYELRRQAYVMPMSAGILAMQDLFKLAPSRLISSLNKCPVIKTASVRVANGV